MINNDFVELIKSKPKFDEYILRAAEDGKLIFFLGAGVSRIMGIKGWDAFSKELIEKAYSNYQDQTTILGNIRDSKERITIAYKKFEEDKNLEEFYNCFGNALKPDEKIFKSKTNIYKLLSQFDATFLTTNADNLFEEVLGEGLCHEEYSVTDILNTRLRRQNRLFYLHGHYSENIDIKKNNLVFTAPQYVQKYNDDKFKAFLESVFQNNNVILFIGYGLNELEIMDYIVTKAGHSSDSPQKVYVLYGFCENEDIIYYAKKSYFEALNINVIPFNMSSKGYDSLIDVLIMLLDDYKKRTVVPTAAIIHESINDFSEANCAYILHCLRSRNEVSSLENEIVQGIKQIKSFQWTERLYKEGLFSVDELNKKLELEGWPLLELLADWVKSDICVAQEAAINFLNQITIKQKNILAQKYTYINKYIVEIILSLNKSHIKIKYLKLMELIVADNHLFYHELFRLKNTKRISQWNNVHIKRLFDYVFRDTDFDDYKDNKSFTITEFFKRFNKSLTNNSVCCFVFSYFVNVLKVTVHEHYSRFLSIYNLDNIYKSYQVYLILILDEIKFSFSKLTNRKQISLLKDLMEEDNEVCCKLALYLARKYDHNIEKMIRNNSTIFSSYACYHELYLLLKHHIKKEYLSMEVQNDLINKIIDAKFGVDKYDKEDDAYYNNLILSKRLALLELLTIEKSERFVNEIVHKNVEPYQSEMISEQCDYVHSSDWVNETQISHDMFIGLPASQWGEKFNETCLLVKDNYELSDNARKFISIMLERSEEEIDDIIKSFINIPHILLSFLINELHTKLSSLQSYDVLIETCLKVLEMMIEHNSISKQLAKEVFRILSDVEMENLVYVDKTLSVIDPWLTIALDEEDTFSGGNQLLNNLINYGDFYKFSLFINCYICLKTKRNYELSDGDIDKMIGLLEIDGSKKIYRYTLSYNYQNLKYIAQNKSYRFSNALLSGEQFTMSTLMMCILNSKYVFDELAISIKDKYLDGHYPIPNECNDKNMTSRLYDFIIASCFYEKLAMTEFEKACNSSEFVDYFLHTISIWSKKEGFVMEDWLVPCWSKIKNIHQDKLQDYACSLLYSINDIISPSERLLFLYSEAVLFCASHSFVHVKMSKVLEFCSINIDVALELAHSLIKVNDFVNEDQLIEFTNKCIELDRKDNVRVLLNELSDEGKLGLSKKDELAHLLR